MLRRPAAVVGFRLREKASVFLAELHPAFNADQRTAILGRLRKRDHDATHHCSAWREGAPASAWGADDDGEPNGTAGPPMLRVLAGEGLTDCLAVCIRWYGGTKLGTGGLVRAYTESLHGAISEARTQGLLEEIRIMLSGEIRTSQELAHLPFTLLGLFPGMEAGEQTFDSKGACLRFRMPPGREAELEQAWNERSRGGSIIWT
jgi:uncharacterized YigZ family protein